MDSSSTDINDWAYNPIPCLLVPLCFALTTHWSLVPSMIPACIHIFHHVPCARFITVHREGESSLGRSCKDQSRSCIHFCYPYCCLHCSKLKAALLLGPEAWLLDGQEVGVHARSSACFSRSAGILHHCIAV